MQLFVYDRTNFGDAMNWWLWPRLLPGLLDDDASTLFIGIGSLLNSRVPPEPRKVVFGAGVGYARRITGLDDRWTVYCVRGPLTASALGLDHDLAITDSAALVRALELAPEPEQHPVSYLPHSRSMEYWDWAGLCDRAGVTWLDPRAPFEETLRKIRRSRLLITEAMHGAIVADALRIPWVPVRAYKHILEFKWRDWSASLEMDYRPINLLPLYARGPAGDRLRARLSSRRDNPLKRAAFGASLVGLGLVGDSLASRIAERNVRTIRKLADGSHARLSGEETIRRATERLLERLDLLRRDVAAGRFAAPAGAASPAYDGTSVPEARSGER